MNKLIVFLLIFTLNSHVLVNVSFASGDSFVTSELESLSKVKPELILTAEEKRIRLIDDLKQQETSWWKKRMLEKFKEKTYEEVKEGWFLDESQAEEAFLKLKEVGWVKTVFDIKTGQEKQINAKLLEQGEVLVTTQTPYELSLPKRAGGALTIAENATDAGGEISFTEQEKKIIALDNTPEVKEEVKYYNWKANDVGSLFKDNKLIYKDLWEATDLLVTTTEEGIKEDLILKNSSAPTRFEYIVETTGLILEITASGDLVFRDETGQEKFYTPAPDVTDANGQIMRDGIRYEIGWETQSNLKTGTGLNLNQNTWSQESFVWTEQIPEEGIQETSSEVEEWTWKILIQDVSESENTGSLVTQTGSIIGENNLTATWVNLNTVSSGEVVLDEMILESTLDSSIENNSVDSVLIEPIQETEILPDASTGTGQKISFLEKAKRTLGWVFYVNKKNNVSSLFASVQNLFVIEEKTLEIIEMTWKTDQEKFAEKITDTEEFNQGDGKILRRYKLALVMDVEQKDANVLRLTNGTELIYPLDVDPSIYIVSMLSPANYMQEDLKGPITNWVQDNSNTGHFTDGVNPVSLWVGNTASRVSEGMVVKIGTGIYDILKINGNGTGSGEVILSDVVGDDLVRAIYATTIDVGRLHINDQMDSVFVGKLLAMDAADQDLFGYSVSLSGDGKTALIGAYKEDGGGFGDAGSAYVFTETGGVWTQQIKLLASDPGALDYFGYSVSLSSDGKTALIGAYQEDPGSVSNAGSAYVFTETGGVWTQQTKLTASDRASWDLFGYSVSLSSDGKTALIGAYREDPDWYSDAGSAYVFTEIGGVWSEVKKLSANDANNNDEFGFSVALSANGQEAIIGAHYKNNNALDYAGVAYLFTSSGSLLNQQTKILPNVPKDSAYFGSSVAFSANGQWIAVWAETEYTAKTFLDAGAVYVFQNSGGVVTQASKLIPLDNQSGDYFGRSVSFSADGQKLLVGAPGYGFTNAKGSGGAYLFEFLNGEWVEIDQINLSLQSQPGDLFANSVALSSDGAKALIGAPKGTEGALVENGLVYAFDVSAAQVYDTILTTLITKPDAYIDTTTWSDILGVNLIWTANHPNLYYSISFDQGKEYKVFDSGAWQWRIIASDKNSVTGLFEGKWAYRDDSDVWSLAETNGTDTSNSAISQAMAYVNNQMNGVDFTSLNSVQWKALGGFTPNHTSQTTLNIAVSMSGDAQTQPPVLEEIIFSYNQVPEEVVLKNYNTGQLTSDDTPSLKFDLNDPDGDKIKYEIQIDDQSDFSSPFVNDKNDYFADSPRKNVVYTSPSLSNTHWYWRVRAIDINGVASAWKESILGFVVDTKTLNFDFEVESEYSQEDLKGPITNWVKETNLTGNFTDGVSNVSLGIGQIASKVIPGTRVVINGTSYNIKRIDWDGTVTGAVFLEGTSAVSGVVDWIYGTKIEKGVGGLSAYTGLSLAVREETKVEPTVPTDEGYFGVRSMLSDDGNTAVVAEPYSNTAWGAKAGAVYVYVKSGGAWIEEIKLTASDGKALDYFGTSVAISKDGNTIVVGADQDNFSGGIGDGVAYVFTRLGWVWTEKVKLMPWLGDNANKYGVSVAITGDANTVVVGAKNGTVEWISIGMAYVYQKSGETWVQQKRITPTDLKHQSEFGWSVDISEDGNTIVIGANFDSDNFDDWYMAGAVYVFTYFENDWVQQAKLVSTEKQPYHYYGNFVSVSGNGDTVVVSAANDDANGLVDAGAVYVYMRSGGGWKEQKIFASDKLAWQYFGAPVNISTDGQMIVIADDSNEIDGEICVGSVYIFTLVEWRWQEQKKIVAYDFVDHMVFGGSVSLTENGDWLLVGSAGTSQGVLTNVGSAYFYELDFTPAVVTPIGKNYSVISESAQIDVSNLTQIYSVSVSEDLNWGQIWYALSFDDKKEFSIWNTTLWEWRKIISNQNITTGLTNGKWAYRNNADDWSLAEVVGTDTANSAFSQATSFVWNQMSGLVLSALNETNWITQGGFVPGITLTMDLATAFYTSDTSLPTVDQVSLQVNVKPDVPVILNNNNGGLTSDTPVFGFNLNDADGNGLKYQIQIDDNNDFSSPEIDFIEADFIASPRLNVIYRTTKLVNNHWYWRVRAIDENGAESDWAIAEIGLESNAEVVKLTFLDQNDYQQEDVSCSITDWVQDEVAKGHFEDGVNPVSIGLTGIVNKVVQGVSVWMNNLSATLVSIKNDGTGLQNVQLSKNIWSAVVDKIWATTIDGNQSKLTEYSVFDYKLTQQAVLSATNPSDYMNFSDYTVKLSADGNTAVVWSKNEDVNGVSMAGGVYVFKRNNETWEKQAILSASDKSPYDWFGNSIDVSDDGLTIVVGAARKWFGSLWYAGSVYVFNYNGGVWSEQAKLTASDAETSDYFGDEVAISGDGNDIVVGAYYEDPSGLVDAGSVYVFNYNGSVWSEQVKLTASDKAMNDYFGNALDISEDGNTVVVGADFEDANGINNAGSAYVFNRIAGVWSEESKIFLADATNNDYFGTDLTISADAQTLLISAPNKGWYGVGYAYIFRNNAGVWEQEAVFAGSETYEPEAYGYAGLALSSDGTIAFVGDYYADYNDVYDAGAMYMYAKEETGWEKIMTIGAKNPADSALFSRGAIDFSKDGSTLLVGSPGEMVNNYGYAGVAYVYDVSVPGTIAPTNVAYTTLTGNNQINTSNWEQLEYAQVSEDLNGANLWYSISFNNKNDFKIWNGSNWRTIVSNQASVTGFSDGDWAYRDDVDTWILSGWDCKNSSQFAIGQAVGFVNNRMDGVTLNAMSGSGWMAIGGFDANNVLQNTIDVSTTFFTVNPKNNPTAKHILFKFNAKPISNTLPNLPVLVSPANNAVLTTDKPELSARYIDSDSGDSGVVHYRIATSEVGCLNNLDVIVSGTSLQTTSENQITTWKPSSSIGGNGTYYWCVQNDDGEMQSNWVSMWAFVLVLPPAEEPQETSTGGTVGGDGSVPNENQGWGSQTPLQISGGGGNQMGIIQKDLCKNTTDAYKMQELSSTTKLSLNWPLNLTYSQGKINRPVTLKNCLYPHTLEINNGTLITYKNGEVFKGEINLINEVVPITPSKDFKVIKGIYISSNDRKELILSQPMLLKINLDLPDSVNTENVKIYYYDTELNEYKIAGNGGTFSADKKTIEVEIERIGLFAVLESLTSVKTEIVNLQNTTISSDINQTESVLQTVNQTPIKPLDEKSVTPEQIKEWVDSEVQKEVMHNAAPVAPFESVAPNNLESILRNWTDSLDPNLDTDGDGIPDFWELKNNLNPNDYNDAYLDMDGDGLTNRKEFERGTKINHPDSDNDGLKDGAEVFIYFTNPLNPDTDGDGILDWQEIMQGSNPLDKKDPNVFGLLDEDKNEIDDNWEKKYYTNLPHSTNWYKWADSDLDNLSDYEEYVYGTNPLVEDTDGDGLSDYDEVKVYFTDPNKKDTDSDGLSDYDEIKIYKTNPNKKDTDGDRYHDGSEIKLGSNPLDPNSYPLDQDQDGMPDKWEEKYGLNPNDASDANQDNDNDGLNNRAEYHFNTNPLDANTDKDSLLDGREVQIGTDPFYADVNFIDSNENGVDDNWEIKYFGALRKDLGMQDFDNDGLSDKLEYDYKTNPLEADTDGDGIIDIDEIFVYETDPLNPGSNKGNFAITNIKDNAYLATSDPLIKGIALPGSLVKIVIEDEKNIKVAVFMGYLDAKGVFIGRMSKSLNKKDFPDVDLESLGLTSYQDEISDGIYFVYAIRIDNEGKELEQTKKIRFEIDASLNLNAPNPKYLDDKVLTDENLFKGVEVILHGRIPEVRGTTYLGSQVLVTWKSLILTSSLIADSNFGEFSVRTSEPLNLGDHTVHLYAITPDGLRSREVTIPFRIKEEQFHSVSILWWMNDWIKELLFGWFSFLFGIILIFILILFLIFLWKRRKKEEKENESQLPQGETALDINQEGDTEKQKDDIFTTLK